MGFSLFFCSESVVVIHSEQGCSQDSEWQEEANGTVELLPCGCRGGGGCGRVRILLISFPHHA